MPGSKVVEPVTVRLFCVQLDTAGAGRPASGSFMIGQSVCGVGQKEPDVAPDFPPAEQIVAAESEALSLAIKPAALVELE